MAVKRVAATFVAEPELEPEVAQMIEALEGTSGVNNLSAGRR
jgi:hypothetical protein